MWLRDVPGMAVRSSNTPWKDEMARFVTDIAKIVTPYLAKNGGPIIMAQIENEYGWKTDLAYVQWCGDLANSLGLDIPWVMCNGLSANNTINTCNGNDCASYAEDHGTKYPGQPLAWTEDEGWFEEWDREPDSPNFDNRTPESMAFVVMKWFARGGCHHNYYMWYGGNHFGRWAGSSIANKYADGVNLHHDALPNEPKKTHLQQLHMLLAKYGSVLLDYPSQVNSKYRVQVFDSETGRFITATDQWGYLYKGDGGGVLFIENEANVSVLVKVSTGLFELPAYSSTLAEFDTLNQLYNSAKVDTSGLPTKRVFTPLVPSLNWKAWQEDVTNLQGHVIEDHPLEQLNFTQDTTDYLFYQTSVKVASPGRIELKVQSRLANALLVFIDGELQNSTFNNQHSSGSETFSLYLTIGDDNTHQLTLLSVNLGINNGIPPGSFDYKGIVGSVILGSENITKGQWLHRSMLEGEILQVFTAAGSANVTWDTDYKKYANQSVVWFQAVFPRVEVKSGHSMMLDMAGMGRGHMFLNGFHLGRYWSIQVGGAYVQRYYFIPPDLIADSNLLTVVEELGAPDPGSVAVLDSTFVVP